MLAVIGRKKNLRLPIETAWFLIFLGFLIKSDGLGALARKTSVKYKKSKRKTYKHEGEDTKTTISKTELGDAIRRPGRVGNSRLAILKIIPRDFDVPKK